MNRFQPGVALLLSLLWEVRWAGAGGSAALAPCGGADSPAAAGSPGRAARGSAISCAGDGGQAGSPCPAWGAGGSVTVFIWG